ncbi:MAG: hypothetical protein JSV51_06245 [Candidatus Bathyarchaeota archaeon]|nr:MAG: hypothetical protein JSV51_06245 [Candidatus Bathyarchaeota archaeon]
MTEFLVLLKLHPGKLVEAIDSLRKLPTKPSSGVDLCYTMNIFGTWDVGVWFDAENTSQAIDFVHNKIKDIPGVNDTYTVPTFPHGPTKGRSRQAPEPKTE